MSKSFFRKLIPVFFVCMLPTFLFAQNPVGYNFLRTLVGARASSMGGAFMAIPGDIYNVYYNPAGLAALNKRQGTLTYLNHLLDFQSGFLAYGQPFLNGTIAVGVHYFDYGNFEGKDENNNPTSDFGSNSWTFSVGYSQYVIKGLSLGASGKFINFKIAEFSENALAVDLAAIYSIESEALHFGLGVFNVGTTTTAFIDTKDDLPMSVQFGASKQLEHLPLLVSAALIKYKGESLDFRFGGELNLTDELFLRLGYNSVGQDQKVDSGKDQLAGVSLGLGFKLSQFNLDYSFSSFGEVGSLNRLSLTGRF